MEFTLGLYEWNNMCIQHRNLSDFLYLVAWIFVKGLGKVSSEIKLYKCFTKLTFRTIFK